MENFYASAKVKSILNEFTEKISGEGILSNSEQLKEAATRFADFTEKPEFKIEFSYFSTPKNETVEKALDWILNESEPYHYSNYSRKVFINHEQFQFNFLPVSEAENQKLGNTVPLLKLFLLNEHDLADDSIFDKLEIASTIYPYIIVLSEVPAKIPMKVLESISSNLLFFESYSLDNLPSTKLVQRFDHTEFIGKLNTTFNYIYLNTLESLKNILALLTSQEERLLKAKKVINQQQITNSKSSNNISVEDITNNINNDITAQFTSVESGIVYYLENNLTGQNSAFVKFTEELAATMPRLDESDTSKATVLTISPAFEKAYLDKIYEKLLKTGQENLVLVRDAFTTIKADIEQKIENNAIVCAPLNFKLLTDQQLVKLLDTLVRLDKPYTGSLPKQGLIEYLIALSRFVPILLAIMSALAIYFTKGNPMAATVTVPIVISIFIAFIVIISKSLRKEHKENKGKEQTKAKDYLMNEAKKMASEFTKSWQKIIGDHLRAQLAAATSSIETSVKDFGNKRNSELAEGERRLQRQIQNLENSEKKIETLSSYCKTLSGNIGKLKTEIRQSAK
jgi:hypothetical protein